MNSIHLVSRAVNKGCFSRYEKAFLYGRTCKVMFLLILGGKYFEISTSQDE
jgi:hypothetical protein